MVPFPLQTLLLLPSPPHTPIHSYFCVSHSTCLLKCNLYHLASIFHAILINILAFRRSLPCGTTLGFVYHTSLHMAGMPWEMLLVAIMSQMLSVLSVALSPVLSKAPCTQGRNKKNMCQMKKKCLLVVLVFFAVTKHHVCPRKHFIWGSGFQKVVQSIITMVGILEACSLAWCYSSTE